MLAGDAEAIQIAAAVFAEHPLQALKMYALEGLQKNANASGTGNVVLAINATDAIVILKNKSVTAPVIRSADTELNAMAVTVIILLLFVSARVIPTALQDMNAMVVIAERVVLVLLIAIAHQTSSAMAATAGLVLLEQKKEGAREMKYIGIMFHAVNGLGQWLEGIVRRVTV